MMRPSSAPLTSTSRPPRAHATQLMMHLCPRRRRSFSPVDASQTISVPSAELEKRRGAERGAFGDHAMLVTALECPASVPVFLFSP